MPTHNFNFALNDFLSANGPLLEVDITVPLDLQQYLAQNILPPYSLRSGHALIDTGAGVSAVDESIFAELEIPSTGSESVWTPNGIGELKLFDVSANFPELSLQHVPLKDVFGCKIRGQSPPG